MLPTSACSQHATDVTSHGLHECVMFKTSWHRAAVAPVVHDEDAGKVPQTGSPVTSYLDCRYKSKSTTFGIQRVPHGTASDTHLRKTRYRNARDPFWPVCLHGHAQPDDAHQTGETAARRRCRVGSDQRVESVGLVGHPFPFEPFAHYGVPNHVLRCANVMGY